MAYTVISYIRRYYYAICVMTKRQFVVLAFRLFAIYLLFNLIANIGYILSWTQTRSLYGANQTLAILSAVITFLIAFTIIYLIWRKSEWIMSRIFSTPVLSADASEEKIDDGRARNDLHSNLLSNYYEAPVSIQNITELAFSFIGILEVFNSLPRLIGGIQDSLFRLPFHDTAFDLHVIVPPTIEVCLGLWLFLRPWQFQEWIERFKPKAAVSNKESD